MEISFWVDGRPKPKGSLRHVGKGRMVEQVAGSKPWREMVAWTARSRTWPAAFPLTGGVMVVAELFFQPPKRCKPGALPTTRATGDSDKLSRNILDALTDAGVVKDDSQVVDLHVSKRYAPPQTQEGALITVREIPDGSNDLPAKEAMADV